MEAKNDRIIVQKANPPSKSGSIYIPDSAIGNQKVKLNFGRVLMFGLGCKLQNGDWVQGYQGNVGDIVVWEQFGDVEMRVLGKDVCVIRAEDVVAVVDESELKGYTFEDQDGGK